MQTLAETGMRGIEALKLLWSDVDFERHTINVRTAKNGEPRLLSLTNMHGILTKDLFGRLKLLPKKNDKVFGKSSDYYSIRNGYTKMRKRIAYELNNPDINKLTFHKLRHYVGTMLYIKTKCPETVKYLLGHTNLNSTSRYIHYAEALYNEPDEFIVKIANTDNEQIKLMEQGFDLCDISVSGKPILRKRK